MAHNLFDHGSHLVHLDGIYDKVPSGVFIFLGGTFETFGNLANPVVKNVGETQEEGSVDITELKSVHHVLEVDRWAALFRRDLHVSFLVD